MKISIEFDDDELEVVSKLFGIRKIKSEHKKVEAAYGDGEYKIDTEGTSKITINLKKLYLVSLIGLIKNVATDITTFVNIWCKPEKITDLSENKDNDKEEEKDSEDESLLQKHPLDDAKDVLKDILNNDTE